MQIRITHRTTSGAVEEKHTIVEIPTAIETLIKSFTQLLNALADSVRDDTLRGH